jgi:SpoVK/Ycf46/Vps4 family AAA+-type ATPase
MKEEIKLIINNLIKMPGMAKVKQEIKSLVAFLETTEERQAQGLSAGPDISYHLIFTGNPGTGKTTVARMLATIYRELGIINGGKLVEVTRSDLVVAEKGETAKRSAEKYNEAIDNVLFIDEAYTLVNKKDPNDNGQEAIDELLKYMEDYRDRLIVIVAGYAKDMKDFIGANAGLASRFKREILFEDYSYLELYQIFYKFCRDNQYIIAGDANEAIKQGCKRVIEVTGQRFSNGRDARRLFESVLQFQATRLSKLANKTKMDLMMIKKVDIEGAANQFGN